MQNNGGWSGSQVKFSQVYFTYIEHFTNRIVSKFFTDINPEPEPPQISTVERKNSRVFCSNSDNKAFASVLFHLVSCYLGERLSKQCCWMGPCWMEQVVKNGRWGSCSIPSKALGSHFASTYSLESELEVPVQVQGDKATLQRPTEWCLVYIVL